MNQQSLEWLPIPQFEGLYEINKEGQIRSLSKKKKGTVLKGTLDRYGYEKVTLSKAGKAKTAYIHRLVALMFLPVIENKPYANHVDGDKTNNSVDNLQWVTAKENSKHAFSSKLIKHPARSHRPVLDVETGVIYDSIKSLAETINIPYRSLKRRIRRMKEYILLD